jgi:hypothetical protein
MQVSSQRYKVFGMVTNMDWKGERLIHWQRERCGKSEEAHSVMKEDLAGGQLPSNDFGENAAWWWIMILAMNLNSSMKRLALGESWIPRRMKATCLRATHRQRSSNPNHGAYLGSIRVIICKGLM